MAEFVQKRLEEMIPELEQLERVQLFTKDETDKIKQKRKLFEYKMQKQVKSKDDYLQYVQFEIQLQSLIRVKRKRIGYTHKKGEIDFAIAKRINRLLWELVKRFPSDISLWKLQIEFKKHSGQHNKVSQAFGDMLKFHSTKCRLWIEWAKYELEDQHNFAAARKVMVDGIRHIPDSEVLYVELFRLELIYVEKLLKRTEILGIGTEEEPVNNKDKVLKLALARVAYKSGKEQLKSSSFLLKCAGVARLFSFAEDLLVQILSDLPTDYPDDELCWDTLARNHLEKQKSAENPAKRKFKDRFLMCCGVYEDAAKRLGTSRMWDLYLSTLQEAMNGDSKCLKLKRLKMFAALNEAHDSKLLSERFYITWMNELEKDNLHHDLMKISKEAIKRHRGSVEIWKMRLKVLFRDGDKDLIIKTLLTATSQVGETEDCLSLWLLVLSWMTLTQSITLVKKFLSTGVELGEGISAELRVIYLEVVACNEGIEECRQVFNTSCSMTPYTVQPYKKMISIELAQAEPDYIQIRRHYQLMSKRFGTNNIAVWLEFINFEQLYGDPLKCSQVYESARRSLQPGLVEKFVNDHSLSRLGKVV